MFDNELCQSYFSFVLGEFLSCYYFIPNLSYVKIFCF